METKQITVIKSLKECLAILRCLKTVYLITIGYLIWCHKVNIF